MTYLDKWEAINKVDNEYLKKVYMLVVVARRKDKWLFLLALFSTCEVYIQLLKILLLRKKGSLFKKTWVTVSVFIDVMHT